MMKAYVKPSLEYIELRAEESLACTASTTIEIPVPSDLGNNGNHNGWGKGNGRGRH
ncbi:hypothetical protein [Dehalobacter sp.]|uniref:hypothetical protein n=1 Tax=Dehalobacter sp. TaxID=1962289 RepID=UPI002590C9B2|nr:hypothetical protein [Dehalobacter sp.]MDJ0305581.1 hypothetical protein [Dehalobacter sp.]